MSDDIVTRLRMRPTILRKNQFGDMEADRAATELFNGCHSIMRDAADEIERLRSKLVSKTDELERQYRWHRLATEAFAAERDATIRELRKVEEERDEARRDLCDLYVQGQPTASTMTEKDYAAELGWDCFKEEAR